MSAPTVATKEALPPVPEIPSPPAPGHYYSYGGFNSSGTWIEYGPLLKSEPKPDVETDAEVEAEVDAAFALALDARSPLTMEKRIALRDLLIAATVAPLAEGLSLDTPVEAVIAVVRDWSCGMVLPGETPERVICEVRRVYGFIQNRRRQEHAERQRRRKLTPFGRALDSIAKKNRTSRNHFVVTNTKTIDLFLDCLAERHILDGPFDAAKIEIVKYICRAVGGELPTAPWQEFANEAGVSLGLFFSDAARYAAAREAYEAAQRRKLDWKSKKKTERETRRVADRNRAIDQYNEMMRDK